MGKFNVRYANLLLSVCLSAVCSFLASNPFVEAKNHEHIERKAQPNAQCQTVKTVETKVLEPKVLDAISQKKIALADSVKIAIVFRIIVVISYKSTDNKKKK
jgi:mannitol-specific phosphotransferase system IIBC component